MSFKNKQEEVCRHPADMVRQKTEPGNGLVTYWCLACVERIVKMPKRHCKHAKGIGRCHICNAEQRGLFRWQKKLEEKI